MAITLEDRAQRMIDNAPDYYQYSTVYRSVQEAIAADLGTTDLNNEELKQQLYIMTATWGLKYWEGMLKIPINEKDSYDIRRSRVLGVWRGVGNFSIALIQAIAEAYTSSRVIIRVVMPENLVIIVFKDDFPPNMDDFKAQVENIIHAHLGVNYRLEAKIKHKKDIKQKPKINLGLATISNPWDVDGAPPATFDGTVKWDGNYYFSGQMDDFGPTHKHKYSLGIKALPPVKAKHILKQRIKYKLGNKAKPTQNPKVNIKLHTFSNREAYFNGRYDFDGAITFGVEFIEQKATLTITKGGTSTVEVI